MTIRVKLYKYVYSLRLSKPIFDFESDYLRSSCRSVARMKVTRPGRPSKFFQTGGYRPAATAYSVLEMVTCENSKHNTRSFCCIN